MLRVSKASVVLLIRRRDYASTAIYFSVLATGIMLGKIVAYSNLPFLFVVGLGCGLLLLPLVVIRLDLALYSILLFVIIPFTLSVSRWQEVLEIASFLIPFTFLCWFIKMVLSRDPLVRTPLDVPVFAFLGLILLSYFRNPNPLTDNTNIAYIRAILSLMTYLLVSNIITCKEHIYRLRHVLFGFYNIAFLTTLYIYFTEAKLPMMAGVLFSERSGWNSSASTGGVHGIGFYGTFCILFLLSQPSYIQSKLTRGLLLTIYFAAVPLSGGRSILLVLLGALLLMFLIRKRFRLVFVTLAAVVILFIYIPGYYEVLPAAAQRMFTISLSSDMSPGRFSMWEGSWELIRKHPIFGIGYGMIDSSQLSFVPYHSMGTFSRAPHNGYIFITRSLGLVGISVFGWMIFIFFRKAFRLRDLAEEIYIKDFAFFVIVKMIADLIGIAAGGGESRPRVFFYIGLIGAIYAMYSIAESQPERANSLRQSRASFSRS